MIQKWTALNRPRLAGGAAEIDAGGQEDTAGSTTQIQRDPRPGLVSHNVFSRSFRTSQLLHKSVTNSSTYFLHW